MVFFIQFFIKIFLKHIYNIGTFFIEIMWNIVEKYICIYKEVYKHCILNNKIRKILYQGASIDFITWKTILYFISCVCVDISLIQQYIQHIISKNYNALLLGIANSMSCPFKLHLYSSLLMFFIVEWYYDVYESYRHNLYWEENLWVGNTLSITIRSS